jgi:hypothetical protein
MAYKGMYEGDGFIRKGPEPKNAGEESRTVEKNTGRSRKTWRGGITMFHLMRRLFNH